ncbi:hypothetical protein [Mangrovibrevibacter kandeliae]|uniref:hypothetical protein n=1 Tax=Mangrovibrevibacter kandeliae TaxID=2968473 RepID=UPI002118F202|nr:hypothetical protein [Aurantimonas sp. CSK15Z-1]MCQ8782272.1 hypothetical protein [Aurantimonas sp. CSK15Z-1]
MARILNFELRAIREVDGDAVKAGELVAMKHIDLSMTIETVRVLRSLPDQSYLDSFNQRR